MPLPEQIQAEWDVMILGWARTQEKEFSIVDVMQRLFGPTWVAMTPEHRAISTALHRMPREEFVFSAPIQTPRCGGRGVCTPTWTPVKQHRCEGCLLTRRQLSSVKSCETYGGHNFFTEEAHPPS